MAKLLGPDVPDQMGGGIRVAIDVTFKTHHTATRTLRAAVFGLVELLLRERGHQQPQALQLLGVEDAVEQLVEVGDGHQLALRHIAQVGPGGQKHGRRELGQEVVRQIEIEVEAGAGRALPAF